MTQDLQDISQLDWSKIAGTGRRSTPQFRAVYREIFKTLYPEVDTENLSFDFIYWGNNSFELAIEDVVNRLPEENARLKECADHIQRLLENHVVDERANPGRFGARVIHDLQHLTVATENLVRELDKQHPPAEGADSLMARVMQAATNSEGRTNAMVAAHEAEREARNERLQARAAANIIGCEKTLSALILEKPEISRDVPTDELKNYLRAPLDRVQVKPWGNGGAAVSIISYEGKQEALCGRYIGLLEAQMGSNKCHVADGGTTLHVDSVDDLMEAISKYARHVGKSHILDDLGRQ